MNKFEQLCGEWVKGCSCSGAGQPEQCKECTDAFLEAVKNAVKTNEGGCRKKLAAGQHWAFCGETDMGQSTPALCTECGGEFKLADET